MRVMPIFCEKCRNSGILIKEVIAGGKRQKVQARCDSCKGKIQYEERTEERDYGRE